MASPKYLTRPVLIGRRICVFSGSFEPETANFELYGPDSNVWLLVPNPSIQFSLEKDEDHQRYIEVEFY